MCQVQGKAYFFLTTLRVSPERDCLGQKTFLGLTIRRETLPLYKSSTRSPPCAVSYQVDLKGRKTPKENEFKVKKTKPKQGHGMSEMIWSREGDGFQFPPTLSEPGSFLPSCQLTFVFHSHEVKVFRTQIAQCSFLFTNPLPQRQVYPNI